MKVRIYTERRWPTMFIDENGIFHPDVVYDENGDPYIPMSAGNIFGVLYMLALGLFATGVLILGILYNSAIWLYRCLTGYREIEKNKKLLPHQYDRYLAVRDPELVDYERKWVRYTTAVKDPPNPARSHLFDCGNGEKGFWEYKC
ncbi:MAG: hypothetical protein ACUVSK_12800 [Desulfotomaculales bacterium]